MTRRSGNTLILEVERPAPCGLCGERVELRPYGPGGMCVCFECGMKDEPEMERQFEMRLKGLGTHDSH